MQKKSNIITSIDAANYKGTVNCLCLVSLVKGAVRVVHARLGAFLLPWLSTWRQLTVLTFSLNFHVSHVTSRLAKRVSKQCVSFLRSSHADNSDCETLCALKS